MVRVFICDHEIVCQGLRTILSTSPDIDVVGVAYNGYQALEQIQKARPDVALMDLKMPGMNGLRATRLIRDKHPQVRVLVLTTRERDEWLFDAIRSGASGYLREKHSAHCTDQGHQRYCEGQNICGSGCGAYKPTSRNAPAEIPPSPTR